MNAGWRMSAERRLVILAANLILVLALGCAAHAQPAPGPVGSPAHIWRAQIHWIPMIDAAGYPHLLQARICRPLVDIPSRIVAVAHGTLPNNRAAVPGRCEAEATRWFLDRGFIVVLALRRGYGATGGDWAEGIYHTPCKEPDYANAGLETARDIAATVDYATALPFARSDAAVVIGQSGGGWGAMAYNTMPHPRVTALISMAGGRGQMLTNAGLAGMCRPDLLADAAGRFGRSATTPMLWIYSENDKFFSPAIAASLYDAFTQNGGSAEFERVGPYSNDGHRLFLGSGGSQIWGPLVARYLAERPAR
jgi:pimeloyl-ACP methyl ester carboxylesterase